MNIFTCFKRHWWWLILVFILLYLLMMMPFAGNQWRSIEQNVAQTMTTSLQQSGYQWVQVNTESRGRDALITGAAPSEQIKDTMLAAAAAVTDVRGHTVASSVTWEGTIAKPIILKSPDFRIEVDNNGVVLSGQLANQSQIDALYRTSTSQYGADRVINRLTVGREIKPVNKLSAMIKAFTLKEGKIIFKGRTVTLEGQTESKKTRAQIGNQIEQLLGSPYAVSNNIQLLIPQAEPIEQPVPQEVTEEPISAESQLCGQQLTELMNSSTILFQSARAQIKNESYQLLDQIVTVLTQCPAARIEVGGHTDSTGNQKMNTELSQQRAQAVISYLIEKGVPANNMTAKGYGSSQPVAENTSATGRAKNRRIEFTIK